MSDFHRNYMYKPTETEKKGRKIKSRHEEACKCLPPFLKLHYHDCPVVSKRCPIHGNIFHQGDKSEKIEREQNVIISFHPSSKTERLLQPIKSLLAHCNSETKINFQYYSPCNSTSKESLKAQHGQNAYENLKRSFNNNILVEKTKSFVTSKSSKVKKLKQCFHSPCNSIAQKTRSQTSIKEKMNQILREEAKQARQAFYNMVPEVPPHDTKQDPTSKWFYSNLKGSRNHEKSDEKMDSDFITVTQRGQNNAINHKIFEIKHRKGLNEIPFVGFPKQPTQLVYSTVNVGGGALNQTTGYPWYEKSLKEENEETGKNAEEYSTENTQGSSSSESSGSIYITPFLFLPKGMDDSDSDLKLKLNKSLTQQMSQAIQVEDLETPTPEKNSISAPVSKYSVMVQASLKSSKIEKNQVKSVSLQTESFSEKRITYSRPICVNDETQSETTVEEIYIGKERTLAKEDFSDNRFEKQSDTVKKKVDSSQSTSSLYREILVTARWDKRMKDQTSQTEDLWKFQISVKAFESRVNKSQNTMQRVTERGMQTSFSDFNPEETEIVHVNSPNISYVIKSFDEEESDQAIDKMAKAWWGKSHSDSDLYERVKCSCCKGENENPFLQCDFSKNSQINSAGEKRTFTKINESNAVPVDSCPKGGSVTLKTKETIECFPDSKQTSTKEEEFSASVSDLSELKKIIQEFFEKRNLGLEKTCKCEKTKLTGTDGEAPKESFIMAPKAEKKETVEKFVNAHVQTQSLPEVEKRVNKETANIEVQTNIGLLLREGGQLKHQKVKLRRTVIVVDDEDQSKSYFICSLCGRDISNTVEATTNTEDALTNTEEATRKTKEAKTNTKEATTNTEEATTNTEEVDNLPEKKEVSAIVGSEYTRTRQIKLSSRTYQSSNPSKSMNTTSKPIGVKIEEKTPSKTLPQSSSSVKKSQIPVFVRFKNERTQISTDCSSFLPPEIHSIHSQHLLSRALIECDCIPSTSATNNISLICDTTPSSNSKDTSSRQKPDSQRSQPRTERRESQTRSKNTGGGQSGKYKTQTYPLIFTPFWPKYFMKTWNSMDSSTHDNPPDSDHKSQTSKQKRSYEKDLEANGNGKKLKVEFSEPLKECSFGKPPLPAKKGQPGDFIIWPNSGFMTFHPTPPGEVTSPSSTDEGNNERVPGTLQSRERSPETYNEFLAGECASFYESNDTEQSSESSLSEEEESEEGEVEEQETGKPQLEIFSMTPKLKLQSLSAMFDNKSFYSDMTTSKSLNEFWVLGESKKNKRKFAKKTRKMNN